MKKWILMKDKKPKDRIFWGFVKGRPESDGYRDAEIKDIFLLIIPRPR